MDLLGEYFQELMADIKYDADISGILMVEAFFERVKDRLTEAGEVETIDRAFYEAGEGAQKLRIDGYGGDPRDSSGILSLIVCDFKETGTPETIGKSDLPPLFNPLLRYLKKARVAEFRESLNEISPGFQVSDLVISTWSQITKVKLILLTNREYVGKVDALVAGNIDGVPVTFNVWDLVRLQKWDSTGRAAEDRVIDFAGEFGAALPALKASKNSEKLESYLLVIPGPQLAAIYDKWGGKLLEANVRSFLQARAATNKGIANTIREAPDLFFSYNNGISATADAISLSLGPDGLTIDTITNLQIVNGGQTTGSIHAALKTSKETLRDVFVQMKLTVVPSDLSDQIVPKISEYANTQNKVNAADFFSNHPFHIRMQEFSRRIIAPKAEDKRLETKWFYERARGQYLDERTKRTEAQRKKFELENPKNQLFSKTDLAKFEFSSEGLPHVVSTGAQKNFAKFAELTGLAWSKSEAKFDETWYKRLIAKAIIFKEVEASVPKQEWYEGGYRANIVTYAIAKLFHDASLLDKHVIDLDMVWRRQLVPSSMLSALLIAAAGSAKIISSPPLGISNVTEWAKKQACWAAVKNAVLNYDDEFDDFLIDVDQARSEVRQVKAARKVNSGVDSQIRVTSVGSKLWNDLLFWGRAKRKLSYQEVQAIEVCASYPKKIPNEFQCQQALSVLERSKKEGFITDSTAT